MSGYTGVHCAGDKGGKEYEPNKTRESEDQRQSNKAGQQEIDSLFYLIFGDGHNRQHNAHC